MGEMHAIVAGRIVPAAMCVNAALAFAVHERNVPVRGLIFAGGALGFKIVADRAQRARLKKVFPDLERIGANDSALLSETSI